MYTTTEMAERLQDALGSSDPAVLRELADYYCYLQEANEIWKRLDALLPELATNLEALLGIHDHAFRNWSKLKPERKGVAPAAVLKEPARALLGAVREEQHARAQAREAATSATPLLERAMYETPLLTRPPDSAYFAYTCALYQLTPVHMAMIQSLVHQGYFEGVHVGPAATGLYGVDARSTRSATENWRQALKALGVTATELKRAWGAHDGRRKKPRLR